MAGATARVVDLSNVKEGGNFNKSRLPSGDYLAKIVKVEDAVAKDHVDQYLFTIQIAEHSTARFPYYCKLQENQLWKLRNIFIAAGKTVPKKKLKIDPNQIVGKLIGVTLEDTEYENKEQSEIAGVFPAAELGDGSSVNTADEPDEDEPEDEDTGDDFTEEAEEEPEDEAEEEAEEEAEPADPYAELTREELKQRIKAQQPDFKVFKSTTDDALREALRLLEVTSDQEEDESPEPATPAPRAAKKRAAAPVSDDDLDDLDIDNL